MPMQIESAILRLARFIFKNNVAPVLIGDEDLCASYAGLGVALPGRTSLMTTMLNKEVALVRAVVDAVRKAVEFYALSSDGWKRKFAEGGTPLINFMALLPDGGSQFIKIVTAAGVRKDHQWIFELHKKMVLELEPDHPERILGFIMDNTSPNMLVRSIGWV